MTTVAPNITAPAYSSALFGTCRWTTSTPLCLGTYIPLLFMMMLLIAFLAWGFYTTPNRSVLEEVKHPSHSPLLPESLKMLSAQALNQALSGVNDLPLKSFLPRAGLEELVEPCAVMGIASIRDMLRINRLALRDIGIGPKEQRIFTRALERRVKLRERMQEAFFESAQVTRKSRGPTIAELERRATATARRDRKPQISLTAAGSAVATTPKGPSSPNSPPRRSKSKESSFSL